ncbi:MAG TPA: hypothetical protein DCL45_01990, partial [Chloroflexi bacterium]|nr:hypothetical protein [Chloroflexota bacterium]
VVTPIFRTPPSGSPRPPGEGQWVGDALRPEETGRGDSPQLVAFFGTICHVADIGGRPFSTDARELYEEGLFIPITHLFRGGVPNEELLRIVRANVREPDSVVGDLHAMATSNDVGGARLLEFLEEFDLPSIIPLADEVIARSEQAMRDAILRVPDGMYRHSLTMDGYSEPGRPGEPDREVPITLACTITVTGDTLHIDFDGTSPVAPRGINVVMNYTHAYSTFAIRSCLNPDLPNNHGSLAPIKISAPKGSIVNCEYPAPVNARHVVGMYVPMPILKALYHVMPERVLAEGAGAVWTMQIQGKHDNGRAFTSSMFNYSGGMGARRTKPGPSATCYPTGVAAVPVEILEAAMPIVFDRKELRLGSGGAGRARGGDGQVIQFHMRTEYPWTLNAVPSRLGAGPEGLEGGMSGAGGHFRVNGKDVSEARKITLKPEDVVVLETPGGGGYGLPGT